MDKQKLDKKKNCERKIANIFLSIFFNSSFGAQQNRHIEMILLNTHNIRFG